MEQFKSLIKNQTLADYNFDTSARDQFLIYFIGNYMGSNLQSRDVEYDIKEDIESIVEKTANIVQSIDENGKLTVCSLGTQLVSIQTPLIQIFVRLRDFNYGPPRRNYTRNNAKINCFEFEIYSDPERLDAIIPKLEESYRHQSHVKINWCFVSNRDVDRYSLYIEHKLTLYDEFYPWLEKGVDSFIKDYLDNDAAILLLHGQPGTGKTSFLKHLLLNNKLNAIISYDERVLNDDRFFIEFLTSDENNLLIVEDAETLLLPRENDSNKVMSKFLNVSDGLIKIADKKMIFTTNVSSLTKIDQALLRKGRCFAAIEFRGLTPTEAELAAKAANLPEKNWKSKSSWTIADIFEKELDTVEKQQQVAKLGF